MVGGATYRGAEARGIAPCGFGAAVLLADASGGARGKTPGKSLTPAVKPGPYISLL